MCVGDSMTEDCGFGCWLAASVWETKPLTMRNDAREKRFAVRLFKARVRFSL